MVVARLIRRFRGDKTLEDCTVFEVNGLKLPDRGGRRIGAKKR